MANNGSQFIYHRFIKPFVKEHEKDFEDAISVGTQLAKDATKKGMGMTATSVLHIPTQPLDPFSLSSKLTSVYPNGSLVPRPSIT